MGRRPWTIVLACLLSAGPANFVEETGGDGKVVPRTDLNPQGHRDGPDTAFYPNGWVKRQAHYSHGRLHGPWVENGADGHTLLTATFRGGKLHGALTHWEDRRPVLVQAFQDGRPVYDRSLEEIQKALADIDTPSRQQRDPLAAEREAALRRLKAYRYLAGVPYDNLVLDEEMNRSATAACHICARLGRMDHQPRNPGMPEADYRYARQGASSSNLAMGYASMAEAVEAWMDDSDRRNVAHLGHRRWCLFPALRKVGFGKSGGFHAMWAFDESQPEVPVYDLISFPARGLMPVEYFRPHYAWSVVLNPAKYRPPDPTVRPKVYALDWLQHKVGKSLPLNHCGVDTLPYGIANCLIFRPARIEVAAGKRYLVEIDGLRRKDGKPAGRVYFVVEFVRLK
jgi:hypothetical protein